jgi:hypothetical protein
VNIPKNKIKKKKKEKEIRSSNPCSIWRKIFIQNYTALAPMPRRG